MEASEMKHFFSFRQEQISILEQKMDEFLQFLN